jgi:hypothetical protein
MEQQKKHQYVDVDVPSELHNEGNKPNAEKITVNVNIQGCELS